MCLPPSAQPRCRLPSSHPPASLCFQTRHSCSTRLHPHSTPAARTRHLSGTRASSPRGLHPWNCPRTHRRWRRPTTTEISPKSYKRWWGCWCRAWWRMKPRSTHTRLRWHLCSPFGGHLELRPRTTPSPADSPSRPGEMPWRNSAQSLGSPPSHSKF